MGLLHCYKGVAPLKMLLFLLLKMAGHGTVLAAKKYTGGYGVAAAAKDDWQGCTVAAF